MFSLSEVLNGIFFFVEKKSISVMDNTDETSLTELCPGKNIIMTITKASNQT